ncbi:hypothetical protein BJX99DRAFT_225121 [Aspergillus californicus]
MNGHHPASRNDFDIAMICALPLETNAVLCSLDEIWHDAPQYYGRAASDDNSYMFGRSGRHAVVVVTLQKMGKVGATSAAVFLKMSFPFIKLALLVGICGAVPQKSDGTEIILGDVIISEILVELDYGRQYPSHFRRNTVLDASGGAREEVNGLLQRMKTRVLFNELHKRVMRHLGNVLQHPDVGASYPGASEDRLFDSEYIHKHQYECPQCSIPDLVCDAALTASCDTLRCDEHRLMERSRLLADGTDNDTPIHQIHFGSIGTSDTVMKSSHHRDKLAESEKVIAFEMEGAGVWNKFNCLIIKGVCDYADSHKNKKWQTYAAVVAASVAKGILEEYVPHDRLSQSDNPSPRSDLNSQLSRRSGPRSFQSFQMVDDTLPTDIFNGVLRAFEERFDTDQVETFRTTDLRALKKELKRIQDEQERARALRNLRRIECFIEKVKQFGQILENILGTSEHTNFIWGPVKALLKIARGQVDFLDTLLSAYEKIGDELPVLGDCGDLFRDTIGLQRVLANLFEDIMEFHENALKLYSGRALKAVFRPLWKDFGPTFENILHRIHSHRMLIEDKTRTLYSHPEQYDMDMREIRDHLRQMRHDVLDLREREAKRQEQKFDEVRDWIAAAETETEHSNICRDRKRYPNSGDWIVDNPKVKYWTSPDPDQSYSPILWINGRPGTGKTYLASVMIEECIKDADWLTCFFYCNEKVEMKTSAIAVLRGILLQLVRKHSELVPYCHAKMKSSLSPTLSDLSTAHTLIETFCIRIPHLYIIVDGLDECEEGRKDVLETFKSLIKKKETYSPGTLRILFLSRPMPEIKAAVPEAAILALGPEHNMIDIQRYCQRRTRELEKFEFSNEILNEAVDRICTRADGMFLFAKLVMNNLAKQPTRRSFHTEIGAARLPKEINEAYTRIMQRLEKELSKEQLKYTKLLLGWLVCSKRPLKWTEIQLVSSVDMEKLEGSNQFDKDLKIQDNVEDLCGSLVQVLKGNRVELVHSTARLFIEKRSDINLAAAECDLTLRCLRYLTLGIFKRHTADSELRESAKQGHFAFQDYATAAWFLHVKTFVETKHAFLDGDVMLTENNPSVQVNAITRELNNFVVFYRESFPNTVLDQSRSDCAFFQGYPFYEDLVRIWDHICSAQRGDLEARNDVSISSLKDTLTRNRTLLEELSDDPSVDFPSPYDAYPFRCPKVMCFYFHEGFRSSDVRENHVNYHELPFHCSVESCSRYVFGFRSNNELTYHMKRYHPEECDLGESFTNLNRREVVRTRWECQVCQRYFVRRNILEDHTRSHKGEKPFCCSECGKGFARKSDMKRHEKIHEKRRR